MNEIEQRWAGARERRAKPKRPGARRFSVHPLPKERRRPGVFELVINLSHSLKCYHKPESCRHARVFAAPKEGPLNLRILPVIDIRHGHVVRGVAGERDAYRPVESRLTPSHFVIDVAEAIRREFGLNELYVADLDAILDDEPRRGTLPRSRRACFQLIVDAGLRDLDRAATLFNAGVRTVVAGLETIPSHQLLDDLCREFGPDRVLFSLDLQNSPPLFAANNQFDSAEPLAIAAAAYDAGIRRIIVLDLAAVGVGNGLSTLPLCGEIKDRFPDIQLLTGGGVRHRDDLRELPRAGIDGVLIATALHNGTITPADLASVI